MTGFDWPKLMQAGLCGLRLHPKDFWELTPAELMLMLGSEGGSMPLSRSRLDELLDAYPDQTGGKNDERE
jgi:uncharacterized phage protein (TIGR02216 family)